MVFPSFLALHLQWTVLGLPRCVPAGGGHGAHTGHRRGRGGQWGTVTHLALAAVLVLSDRGFLAQCLMQCPTPALWDSGWSSRRWVSHSSAFPQLYLAQGCLEAWRVFIPALLSVCLSVPPFCAEADAGETQPVLRNKQFPGFW